MPTSVDSQYDIKVFIKGKEYTSYLTKIRIFNSIENCWPIVDLQFQLDNQAIIEEDVFGQDNIKLDIWNRAFNGDNLDPPSHFDLLYLESNLDLSEKPQNNIGEKQEDHQRRTVNIRCIPFPAMNVMTSFINRLWQEEELSRVPLDFIKEMLELRGYIGDSIIIDTGFNDFKVNQLIIPPTTIKRMTDYIDEKFSIYKGPIFRYCNYAGHFLMWDLFEKIAAEKSNPRFTYIKAAAQYDDPDLFAAQNQRCVDEWGKVYLGHDDVESTHFPNSVLTNYGHERLMITHPRCDLFFLLKRGAPQVIKEQGVWDEKDETKYFPDMKSRKLYQSDSVGFEEEGYTANYSELPITSRYASLLKDMFNIRFTIRENISLRRVMQVGEVCAVEVTSEHEKIPGVDYSGAYIIGSTDIIIDKEPTDNGGDNYDAVAKITAFRTVQTKL